MNIKKISFIFLLTLLVSSFIFGSLVLASGHTENALKGLNETAGAANISQTAEGVSPTTGLSIFLGVTINYLFGAVAIVFIVIILIGGYLWMAARGSQEQIDKAKKFVTNGFFGLMVIFLSYALVFLILAALSNSTNEVQVNQTTDK